MKVYTLFLSVALVAPILAGCSNNDEPSTGLTAKEQELQKDNIAFVENLVIPNYKQLADESIELETAMETLRSKQTSDNLDKACKLWRNARADWEFSESFLFGAAANYYIDPHIDTWPLDKTSLENLLNSPKMMADIDNVVGNLNYGLVGFHGIEYIIFREGVNRSVNDITEGEMNYAVAVAKDLALSCCRLEAAWAGIDNITDAKKKIITDAELEPADNFGEEMRLCGEAGSRWKSVTAGSEQILEGCKDIVDEVGNSKIGKPYTGEDVNYIESPHSYNSIQDFYDNISGVKNAYYGKFGAKSAQTNSISAYLKKINPQADQNVVDALNNCLNKIQAMPKPFVKNYQDAKVKEAIDACNNLYTQLEAARKALVAQ